MNVMSCLVMTMPLKRTSTKRVKSPELILGRNVIHILKCVCINSFFSP